MENWSVVELEISRFNPKETKLRERFSWITGGRVSDTHFGYDSRSLATPSVLTWHRIHANTSHPQRGDSVRQAVTFRAHSPHWFSFPFPTLASSSPHGFVNGQRSIAPEKWRFLSGWLEISLKIVSSILSISYGYPVITNILENISPNYNPNLYLLSIFREERNVTTANYRFRFDDRQSIRGEEEEEKTGFEYRERTRSCHKILHRCIDGVWIVGCKVAGQGGNGALWGRAKRRKREKFSQGRRRVLVKIRRGGRRRRRRRVPRVGT